MILPFESHPKLNNITNKQIVILTLIGILIFLKHKFNDNANVQDAVKLYSILGKTDNYGTDEYQKHKTNLLDGTMLEERNPPHKFISASHAKDFAMKLAGAMKDGFTNATSSFTQDEDLSDNFGKVLKRMTQDMSTIVSGKNFDDCCKNQFRDDNNRKIFLDEAEIFLRKCAWMVLQRSAQFFSLPHTPCQQYQRNFLPLLHPHHSPHLH